MLVKFTTTNGISAYHHHNVVSSNPAHCEVYSVQLYVIKFVSGLLQVGGFLRTSQFPPPKKKKKLTLGQDITEKLLKVALNTIALTLHLICFFYYTWTTFVYLMFSSLINVFSNICKEMITNFWYFLCVIYHFLRFI